MAPPRWLPSRRTTPPRAAQPVEVPAPQGPQGPWLADRDFRNQLHAATLTRLDMVEGVLEDDFPLTEALTGARDHAAHLLNILSEYGILVEAEAAAQIVEAAGLRAGSPFGPAVGQGLARIEALPIDDQQKIVQAAARRYALTAPSRPAPGRTAPVPPPPGPPAASRSR